MYYFIITAIEIAKFYIILRFGFGISKRQLYKIGNYLDVSTIFAFLVLVGANITIFLIPGIEKNIVFYTVWILSEVFVLFEYNLFKLVLMTACSIFLIGNMDSIFSISISIIIKYLDLSIQTSISYVASTMITLIVLIIGIFYISRKSNGQVKRINIGYFILVLGVSFINTMLLSIFWKIIIEENYQENSIKLVTLWLVVFLGILVQIALLLKLAATNHVYKEKDEMNKYYLNLQEAYYLYLEEKERETKKFRHDIKNHMYIMKSLLEEDKVEELSEYMKSVWGKIENLSNGISVNNGVVEAILNQCSIMCKKKNILLEVKGHLPTECFIELFDLCTIFSNLMQNAYEAAETCEEGIIRLTIRYEDNTITIKEENTYIELRKNNKGSLITQKPDMNHHGFGMVNMKECIKKYNGTFEYHMLEDEWKRKWFVIYIMIFNLNHTK